VEVRGLPGGRFPRLDDAALSDFGNRVADAGLQVSGVSPGIFKGAADDLAAASAVAEDLPRACDWARRWNADLVSCFGFARGDAGSSVDGAGEPPNEVVDRLAQMARIAAAHECRLVLENEAVCWGDTGVEAAALLGRVGADNLRLCWDPGNAARAGSVDPFPGEYEQLGDLVAHVHLKNFQPGEGRWSPLEVGVVDWPGQLRALADDGYSGFLVIETHTELPLADFGLTAGRDLDGLSPGEAASRRNLDYTRSLLGAIT
jgi:sugar phosphate isomerase/epimerase